MSAQNLITKTLNLIESPINEAKSMLLTPLNTCSVFIDISEVYLSDNLISVTISWITYDSYISSVAISRKTAQRIAA
ncbi:hypothetical protein THOB06_280017 [Vibrio rotiferianus]|nr:hypothetical protein THOG10_280017 [Vibrio rotiferianus]CAH1580267.1 hypothetical protein THOB06_280017 [Vibrio rotiferianus]